MNGHERRQGQQWGHPPSARPSIHPQPSRIRGSFGLFTKQHVDLIATVGRSRSPSASAFGEWKQQPQRSSITGGAGGVPRPLATSVRALKLP